jgi:purine catabolism regulator
MAANPRRPLLEKAPPVGPAIVVTYNEPQQLSAATSRVPKTKVGYSIPVPRTPGLPLARLVAVPTLSMRVIVGTSADLERSVSWAHSTEMVDPRPHLRDDELVCTVGANLVEAQSCVRFVEAVRASGSAGICLGLGEVHTHAPPALIRACRRMSVALVEMSHGVPFLAVNDVLVEARMRAQTSHSIRDGALMTSLLENLRAGGSISGMLDSAAEMLGGSLSYRALGESVDTSGSRGTGELVGEPIEVHLGEEEWLRWYHPAPKPDAEILAQVGRVIQIARREREDREGERRQRVGQLFSLVVDGLAHHAALLPEIEGAGLAASRLTVSAWPASTAPLVAAHLPEALVADTATVVFVLTSDASVVHKTARELSLVCGYSSPVSVPEIARGIAEARATLLLARNRGSVAGPDSLTSLSALLEQQPRARLLPFVDQLIRPLTTPEVRGGPYLLATLRSFLDHGGSLQATADAEFLHVNTVRHRLRRVSEVVGRNPLDPSDRVDFGIAVWAYDKALGR